MAKSKTPSPKSGLNTLIRQIAGREAKLLIGFILIAVIVCVKLVALTIVDAEALSTEGQQKRTTEYELTAQRGRILDRNGIVLAANVEATTIYANPSEIVDNRKTADTLKELLGGTTEQYLELIGTDKTATFVYIVKKADNSLAEKLQTANQEFMDKEINAAKDKGDDIQIEIKTPLTGIHYLPDSKRYYPNKEIGAQIIGAVDDENKGISGLELTYDNILRGVDGKMVLEMGKSPEQGKYALPIIGGVESEVLAVDGQDIIISIDIKLQQYVEQSLQVMARQRSCDNANTLLLDGSTGEILAAASIPLYDRGKVSDEDVVNGATTIKAITEPYEPGSTFKAFIAGLALENKIFSPDDVIFCPAWLDIYDKTIKDAVERGDQNMSVREIIAQSSNIGVSLIEQKVGDEAFAEFLVNAGMGGVTNVDYPGEPLGGMLADVEDWTPVQAANISFGQGVMVTSLQMASFYGAIANDGLQIKPHFLIARPQYDAVPSYDSRRVLKPSTARVLEDLLRGVVTDGTGKAAGIDGFDVVGKTGTAEKVSKDGGYLEEYIQSFVGYIDNSSSNIVCISAFDNAMGAVAASSEFFPIVMLEAVRLYNIYPQAEAPANDQPAAPNDQPATPNEQPEPTTQPQAAQPEAPQPTATPTPNPEYDLWQLDSTG
jgi:cell division protein FtsI (penicillin-binding protein 3)